MTCTNTKPCITLCTVNAVDSDKWLQLIFLCTLLLLTPTLQKQQEIHFLLWNPKFDSHVQMSLQITLENQLHPLHTATH